MRTELGHERSFMMPPGAASLGCLPPHIALCCEYVRLKQSEVLDMLTARVPFRCAAF